MGGKVHSLPGAGERSEGLPRILVVDDEPNVRELLQTLLSEEGMEVEVAASADQALALLRGGRFDLLLADHYLGGGRTGNDLCAEAHAGWPDLTTIIFTAHGSLDVAVAALRAGACDFLTKPFRTELLTKSIERALRERSLRTQVKRLQEWTEVGPQFGRLLGESRALLEMLHLARRAAASDVPTLLLGETGTGKELVARGLHDEGRRAGGPFQAVNCVALPENLLESELFGHSAGAFTGAKGERKGLFLKAHQGTIFLDEIADMPISLQGKLLRALQEQRVRPVGSDEERGFDVRVVAATNRDVDKAVAEGQFRQDLLYRINVMTLRLPPLRDRGNDILLLGQRFLEEAAQREGRGVKGLSSEAAEMLLGYPWPGNVRELQNAIERAVLMAEFDELRPVDLPEAIQVKAPRRHLPTEVPPAGPLCSLADLERSHIARVLASVRGNKLQAAQILGVDRSTLYRKLARYGILVRSPEA